MPRDWKLRRKPVPARVEVLTAPDLERVQKLLLARYKVSYRVVMLFYRSRRRDATQAVTRGLASTGRVITAAATIMICVFLSFAVGDQRVLKPFGLSLASAVFLDAFVVRSLLGRRTWALPDWLGRRLPHLAIDRPERRS